MIQTRIMENLGKIALAKARKQGLKSIAVKVGSKALPVAGQISMGYTIIKSANCSIECFACY